MRLWSPLVRALAVSAVLASVAVAQDAQRQETERQTDWKTVLGEAGAPDGVVSRLAETGVVVADVSAKQIFSPYIGAELPVFITTDTVLAAYHVLLEESLVRLERVRSERAAPAIRILWDGLPDAAGQFTLPTQETQAALRRARVIVGVALVLLDAETPGATDEERRLIDAEVARIHRATGTAKPVWLGPPDEGFPAIDYGRFRPRGLYADDEDLSGLFRAVVWLQTVPLRVSRPDEFLTAALLRAAFESEDFDKSWDDAQRWGGFVGGLEEFLPSGDDVPLLGKFDVDPEEFDAQVRRGEQPNGTSWINYRRHKDLTDRVIRILPPAALPDTRLFERTSGPEIGRLEPSGLDIAALLGSRTAHAALPSSEVRAVVANARESLELERALYDGCLYEAYLYCLQALFDEPEPEAPELFGSAAWDVKTTNTALAGWAQLRHAWALQAKESEHWVGVAETVPGFVEPDPKFFGRFAMLCERTERAFAQMNAFSSAVERREFGRQLKRFVNVVRASGALETGDLAYETLGQAEQAALRDVGRLAAYGLLGEDVERSWGEVSPDDAQTMRSGFQVLTTEVEALIAEMAGGKLRKPIADFLDQPSPLPLAWRELERLAGRLESLAHRQLRGVALGPYEAAFIRTFGERLAAVMLYAGNSYLDPLDDAPRVASIHALRGGVDGPRHLHVGTARPRVLYVLYPSAEGPVACQGAVLPYREVYLPSRLTDAAWKRLLDSDEAPDWPEWMAPILAPR